MAGLAKLLRMRRKPTPVETWVYFDPDDADQIAPSWGLLKREGEWWYDDGRSRFTVNPGCMVKLDEKGEYIGSMQLRSFWDKYEAADE